ncbi:hypothetical protein OG840_53015 [Streptomyces sp. NBC_01764]|uniref:hypothetical protein n=1 Tax=Streptomyces sp. NBC_01764 TaxID=2975935 RepID=UPI00224D0093|nr:hypothetical protein [Streptomyces sp. NBC_01764]MCX4410027.1 hypothetical protein [Streptomyces sp. NBC_01764]
MPCSGTSHPDGAPARHLSSPGIRELARFPQSRAEAAALAQVLHEHLADDVAEVSELGGDELVEVGSV